MNKAEKKCRDMADVCELAHRRTVRDINKLNRTRGLYLDVNCQSLRDCGDEGNVHKGDAEWDEHYTHYGAEAQQIFDGHYDYICRVTGL